MNDWQDDAACRGHEHPEWWFPPEGQHGREAKAVCNGIPDDPDHPGCPVRAECLQTAIANREKHGIWGGQVMHRFRRRPLAARPCEICGGLFVPRTTTDRYDTKRCAELAHRVAERERIRRARGYGVRLERGHGTISKYNKGCRCPACKAVSRDKSRLRRVVASGRVGAQTDQSHTGDPVSEGAA